MSTGELTELDTVEVSLVDRGANRKRFAFRKQEKVMAKQTMTKAQRAKVAKVLGGKTLAEIRKTLEGVSAGGRQAIMAAIGILASAKAELPDGMLQEIMTAAGIETPDDMIDLLSGDADEDAAEGEEDATANDEAPADDAGDGISDDGSEAAGSDNEVVAEEYSAASDTGDENMPNETKKPTPPGMSDTAKKSLAKAEKDAADAATKATALQKALDDSNAKTVELEKQVKVERDARVLKEFVAKAAVFKHLPVKSDDLGAVLKSLHDAAPEATAKLEKMLADFNTKAAEVEKLTKELGHSRPGEGGETSAWAQIQKAAGELRKVDAKLTEEGAITKAIELNPKLYDEYLGEQSTNRAA